MKRFLLLFLFFISLRLFVVSQALPPDAYLGELPIRNGMVNYQGVDSVPGVGKDVLYIRAKTFLSKAYPSFKDVVKLDDKELGKITVRGLFQAGVHDFMATTDIYVKEGKFKYEISHLVYINGGYSFPMEQMIFNRNRAVKWTPNINSLINQYIASLGSYMKSSQTDNW